MSDVGYGTLAGLVIPAALLRQLGGPRSCAAGLRMLAAAACAYVAAGALAHEARFVLAGLVVAAVFGALGGRVPLRAGTRRPGGPAALVLGLSVVAALPGLLYVLQLAGEERDGLGQPDAHLGLGHWAALAAAALAAVFVALLEGIAADGLVLSGLTASAVVLVWAVTCLVYPASAGAVDGTWAAVAIWWSLAFAAATLRASRSSPR